tara:strand:- start:26222 stop:26395 length:174 start_codon:yes stop_codon:yes gene_type:complete
MIKNIKKWAKMKKQTYREVGIFNVTITAPANYVGWAMLGAELFVGCLLLLTIKYLVS